MGIEIEDVTKTHTDPSGSGEIVTPFEVDDDPPSTYTASKSDHRPHVSLFGTCPTDSTLGSLLYTISDRTFSLAPSVALALVACGAGSRWGDYDEEDPTFLGPVLDAARSYVSFGAGLLIGGLAVGGMAVATGLSEDRDR